jgi:signal peptidase I
MYPTLSNGDFVVSTRWIGRIRVGDVLLIDHPVYGRLIKRVLRVSGDRSFLLTGDNAEASVSPERLGWVNRQWVLGKHLMTFKRAD